MKSISMIHAAKDPASVITMLEVHRRKGRPYTISASGIPNWIFLIDVIVHLATRSGVQVDGLLSEASWTTGPARHIPAMYLQCSEFRQAG